MMPRAGRSKTLRWNASEGTVEESLAELSPHIRVPGERSDRPEIYRRCWKGLLDITLPLSGRQGSWGGEAES
jgi:hypothetical protein